MERAGFALLALGTVLYLTVSAPLLTALGIPYDAPSGAFIFKLHPGTYVLLAATGLLLAATGNPLRGLAGAVRDQPLMGVHFASTVVLLGYSVLRHGPSGSAFIIETLMMAPLCGLALTRLEPDARRRLFGLIMALVALNAAIAVVEAVLKDRLIPLTVAGGVAIPDAHFRATALQGHPLENAQISAPFVLLAGGMAVAAWARGGLSALLLLGLLCFGGRTAFVASAALLGGLAAWTAVAGCLRGRWSYGRIMGGGVLAVLALAAGIGAVLASGMGERVLTQLVWDDSAEVRLRVWGALDYMSAWDVAFGIPPHDIEMIIDRLGLNYPLETIENFWLLMLMQLGAVGLVPFTAGLAAGVAALWRGSGGAGRLALLLFLGIASSNNSLASKSHALAILFLALGTMPAAYTISVGRPRQTSHQYRL